MVVAEQPTSMDDAYGRPFIGRGLKEVKAVLEAAGIEAHYTYALKCVKPDRDTKPKPAHVKICRTAYLRNEIAQVKPKHIIVLGSNAIYATIGTKKKLTECQGTRFFDEKLGAWVYSTLHFAQALYSEENRHTMHADLKLFVRWIKGGENVVNEFNPPVYVVDTIRGLRAMARHIEQAGGVVAVDTETQGLNPFHADRNVRSIQFCWNPEIGGVFVPLLLEPDCYYTEKDKIAEFWQGEDFNEAIKILRKILYNSRIIWHNGKFDRKWLWMWGLRNFGSPIKCPNIYMDTMHVAYLINENRALKLKRLITSELGFPSYDIPDKMTKDMDLLIPYSTKDTVGCYLLARRYAEQLGTPDLSRVRKFYFNVLRRADALYTKMELEGWPVHLGTAKTVNKNLTTLLNKTESELHEILKKEGIAGIETAAFASYKKLSKIIWEDLRLIPNPDPLIAYTDVKTKETLSTNEDALIHVKSHPFVAKLLEWRALAKALQTYAVPMLHAAETRGKLTTSYKLAKVVTGRTASGKEEGTGAQGRTAEGMNLQNIPPTYGIKGIIRSDDPEWWVMEIDFGQIELRIAGELSGDEMLLWAYQNGIDLHTYRAQRTLRVTEKEWEALEPKVKKKFRTNAKPVNFGYIFGMSWRKFRQYALVQYGVDFTSEEAQENRRLFFEDHHGLEKWYGKQERMAQRLGYVETLSGQRRHLRDINLNPDLGKEAKRKYQEAVRQSINSPVQGMASHLKTMAAIEVDSILDPRKAKLFGEIHDSILLLVKKSCIQEVAAQVLPIMQHPKLLDVLGIKLSVPIEADIEVGPSLGQKRKIEEWPELCAV